MGIPTHDDCSFLMNLYELHREPACVRLANSTPVSFNANPLLILTSNFRTAEKGARVFSRSCPAGKWLHLSLLQVF